jgi:hypothetical protein
VLKRAWKRARDRYLKRKKVLGTNGVEDEFMKSMSFLNHNGMETTQETETETFEKSSYVHETSQFNEHSIDVAANDKDENNDELWMDQDEIDEKKLIKLVQNKGSIWKKESKKDKRNNTRRKLAWAEIEQNFSCKLVLIARKLIPITRFYVIFR